jgi:hypothetical protein
MAQPVRLERKPGIGAALVLCPFPDLSVAGFEQMDIKI